MVFFFKKNNGGLHPPPALHSGTAQSNASLSSLSTLKYGDEYGPAVFKKTGKFSVAKVD